MTPEPDTSSTAKAPLSATELRAFLRSETCRRSREEFADLVRRAKPLYVERLSSIPFYAARKGDDNFWFSYISSRAVAARILVETHEASLKKA
jgi:hypothetical protein